MKKVIFAGSFDPFHKGHYKVVVKAATLFDHVVILVANNKEKKHKNILADRKQNIESQIMKLRNVSVDVLKNEYVAEYALKNNINYLVRSGRNDLDFGYELQMAKVNKTINNQLETIIIIPDYDDIKISSSSFKNELKTINK